MAKLSARGRYEIARIAFENNTAGKDFTYQRYTYAYMSDGNVLKKTDVTFTVSDNAPDWARDPQKHTWNWKIYGKFNQDITPEQFKDFIRGRYKRGNNPNWIEITK